MHTKFIFLLAFFVLAVIQWVIPGRIISKKTEVLEKGQSYKFQTEPVDPSNPFKGKYITLDFRENSFTDTVERRLGPNEEVYVLLSVDTSGYAIIRNVSTTEPETNSPYVKADVSYVSRSGDSITVFIHYPFNEFYMDEFKAPKAETIYQESSRDSSDKTYALVKIWKGQAVIQDVLINDTSIIELTR